MDSEKLSAFLSFLRESEAGYNAMLAALTDSDAATQDLLHFLELRDSDHAQSEIKEYAVAIKKLIKPLIPNVAAYFAAKGQEW